MDLHLQKISLEKSKNITEKILEKIREFCKLQDQLTNSLVFSENHPINYKIQWKFNIIS